MSLGTMFLMIKFRLKELIARWELTHSRRLPMMELAKLTSIDQSTLSRIAGPKEYVTTTRNIEQLCRFFGVGSDQLLMFVPPIGPPVEPAPEMTEEQRRAQLW